MSRSYRRPYAACTGTSSAKQDKIYAHRGVRRAQNRALRDCADYEELFMPHKLECSWNEVYSWGRDGKQSLHFPPGLPKNDSEFELWFEYQTEYYAKLCRK